MLQKGFKIYNKIITCFFKFVKSPDKSSSMSGLSATHNANFLTITLFGLFSSKKKNIIT